MTKAEAIAMLKRIQEPEAWEPQINQAAFEALDMAIEALSQESSEDVISRQAAIDAADRTDYTGLAVEDVKKVTDEVVKEIKKLPSAQPTQTDTSNTLKALDCVERQAAIDAANDWLLDCLKIQKQDRSCGLIRRLEDLPSAQSEWDNHTVACLLADLFGDSCACNYNGIDEWLPEKCEVIDACPNPVGVACWEQYLKHRAERREE